MGVKQRNFLFDVKKGNRFHACFYNQWRENVKKRIVTVVLGLSVMLLAATCGTKDRSTETVKTTETSCIEDTEATQAVATDNVETTETEEATFWDKVGIKAGIATVYNGRKSSIMSTNIKQNPAFLQE